MAARFRIGDRVRVLDLRSSGFIWNDLAYKTLPGNIGEIVGTYPEKNSPYLIRFDNPGVLQLYYGFEWKYFDDRVLERI